MSRFVFTILLLAVATSAAAGQPSPIRPVSTYSIVALDPDTGELGVAVQSHWFSVGALVTWAEAGVGAVATQSLVDRIAAEAASDTSKPVEAGFEKFEDQSIRGLNTSITLYGSRSLH